MTGQASNENDGLLSRERMMNVIPSRIGTSRVLWGSILAVGAVICVLAFGSRPTRDAKVSFPDLFLETEGKSHANVCEHEEYTSHALKLSQEITFHSLFPKAKGMKKFEASSVISVDDSIYAICDSSWAIFKFNRHLLPLLPGAESELIGDPDREKEDSGYEALFHVNGILYVVRESVQHDGGDYHAVIEEIDVNGDEDYNLSDACSTEFEFEGDSKGFEGAIAVQDLNDELVVLGLCEGNHCSEKKKKKLDSGHGRLVAMRKETLADGTCQWATSRKIKIPKSADFIDYSAMTMDDSGKVAISSQENSALWVGQLLGQNEAGLWDIDAVEFDKDVGEMYIFPKDSNCETVYCNIEGVNWLDENTIIAVSDKMKGGGKQDFRCGEKDESVHIFTLP